MAAVNVGVEGRVAEAAGNMTGVFGSMTVGAGEVAGALWQATSRQGSKKDKVMRRIRFFSSQVTLVRLT
jgi:hypothetical protein